MSPFYFMKRILFIISILISVTAYSQTTGFFRYDTVTFQKVGANSEFNLLNSTRAVTGGVLTNVGNGRTRFVLPAATTKAKNGTTLTASGDTVLLGGTVLDRYTVIPLNGFPLTINQNGISKSAKTDSGFLRFTNNTTNVASTDSLITPGVSFHMNGRKTQGGAASAPVSFFMDAYGVQGNPTGNGIFQLKSRRTTRDSVIFSISAMGILQQNLNVNGTIFGNTGVASTNVRAGDNTMISITTALNNTAIGDNALTVHKTGDNNTAAGYGALFSDTSGSDNTAIGERAMFVNKNGVQNTAVGKSALANNTTGSGNVAFGNLALGSISASNNVAIGNSAMSANTAGGVGLNTAVGGSSLLSNTTGEQNAAFGFNALRANTDAIKNTAIGTAAMEETTTGGFNTAVGQDVMLHNLTGINNTAVGHLSGATATAGNGNVSLGYIAGTTFTSGDNNIWIGNQAGTHANQALTPTNSIAIGYNSFTTASNMISIGNTSHIAFQAFGIPHNTPASATMLVYDTLTGFFYHQAIPAGGGSGVTTMTAFGSAPNANAGTISGSNLTLQPADGTNPGGISLSAQTMGDGRKTFLKQAVFPNGLSITGARTNADGFVLEYVGGNTSTITSYNGGYQDFQLYANNMHFYGNGANPVSISSGGNLGVGIVAASTAAKLHVVNTTEQIRSAYDASNYLSITTGSTGNTTFDLVGTSPAFTFNKQFTATKQASFNDDGEALNFRVESDNNQNMFLVDGVNDRVGVGVAAGNPNSRLHVDGSFATAYRAITALRTLDVTDHTIEVTSGTFTITLPTAVGITGRQYVITNSGSGVVTIATTSSQTFINVTATPMTLTLNQFSTVTVVANGAVWLRTSSL